ncbi:MAG: DUF1192 family protein [Dongiaceae bacterium]
MHLPPRRSLDFPAGHLSARRLEIARVETKIATKQSHRAGGAAFFKSP